MTPKPSSADQAKETLQTKVIATKNAIADAFRYIDYARERQYDIQ